MVCACAADAASESAANPKMAGTFFISLLLFPWRLGINVRQAFLRDNLHRVFYGYLRDAGTFVNPCEFLVGLGVRFQLVAPILLWVGCVPGNALQPRLGRQFPLMSLAGRRRGRLRGGSEIQSETQDVNANQQGRRRRQAKSEEVAIDGAGLNIASLEGDVGVARLARVVALIVGISAHGAPGSPQDSGRKGKKRILPQIESKKAQPQSAERERQDDVQP